MTIHLLIRVLLSLNNDPKYLIGEEGDTQRNESLRHFHCLRAWIVSSCHIHVDVHGTSYMSHLKKSKQMPCMFRSPMPTNTMNGFLVKKFFFFSEFELFLWLIFPFVLKYGIFKSNIYFYLYFQN